MTIESPVGPVTVVGDDGAVTAIHLGDTPAEAGWRDDRAGVDAAVEQLEAYFAGTLHAFTLELRPTGTPFQQRVWGQLAKIPYGEVTTYGEIARRVGTPSASRAVGAANGRNPIAIVVPCHRVIGANGTLTGYAGGMWRKEWLLAHEGHILV
ncbi:MAG: methylated-DNA--[protein]-cysteine S-methyltransferase [Acidimicrobiales bacterium]